MFDETHSFDEFGSFNERLTSQIKRLRRIKEGLQNGNLQVRDLSLGIDPKRGISSIDLLIPPQVLEAKEGEIASSLLTSPIGDASGYYADSESRDSWQKYRASIVILPTDDAQTIYFKRHLGFAGRVELSVDNADITKTPPTYDIGVARNFSHLLAVARLAGIPIHGKHTDYYLETLWTRNFKEAIDIALLIFNTVSADKLIAQLKSMSPFLSYSDANPEFAIQQYTMVTPFPTTPVGHSEYGTIVDPSIAVKNRVSSLAGLNPQGAYLSVRDDAMALLLGRMGAVARFVYNPLQNETIPQGEENTGGFIRAYLSGGIDGLKRHACSQVYTMISPEESRAKTSDSQLLLHLDKKILAVFNPTVRNKGGNNLYALVDWKQKGSEERLRFIFLFRISPIDAPEIYKAAKHLLEKS